MLSHLLKRPLIPRLRLAQMASHISGSSSATTSIPTSTSTSTSTASSISDLPKSWHFTSHLPPDPLFSTPKASHDTPREDIGPRQVKGALFTWVRPAPTEDAELLAISKPAFRDLGIRPGDEETEVFKATVAGNYLHGWDESKGEGGYPWAQCYGGWQFGSWAGQLGDGRAISLFETTNPATGVRWEVQLKGAGLTPYSRFADGKAVLRSSIREFVVSEALNALRIPTTRALSLTLLPKEKIRRETLEPGAIVARFAQSWLRIGTFDLLRARGERDLVRQLSTYIAEEVFPGWESLPARLPSAEQSAAVDPPRGVAAETIEGPEGEEENRFTRLYREIVRRNAKMVASWQAYAFTNGVLNTDNTSIFGLSIDFGPFAFLDNFDPNYTPNHDDYELRYSYRNQPTIIWWNLVRLGETFGELIGAGPGVDEEVFRTKGIKAEDADALIKRAEGIIDRTGEEYKAVFLAEYKRLMTARLGLKVFKESDFDELFSELLDTMEALEIDFNQFFRKLSNIEISKLTEKKEREEAAGVFFHKDSHETRVTSEADARARVGNWLEKWSARVREDWGEEDAERMAAMKKVNPKFIPKGWVLDEIIKRVEKDGEREVLGRVMEMVADPFKEEWGGDREEEERWCGDVPRGNRAMMCSCSS